MGRVCLQCWLAPNQVFLTSALACAKISSSSLSSPSGELQPGKTRRELRGRSPDCPFTYFA